MLNNNILKKYNNWLNNKSLDKKSKDLLLTLTEKEIEDCFYKDLSFGTAGMRGIIGVGTNRFNIYTLRKANYGYAQYLLSHNKKNLKVVIARDNRYMGEAFVEECVKLLSKFNIKCYVFDKITPTPVLSYAIRFLKADGGIVITASHNPKQYNGYKIYDNTGCQLTPDLSNVVFDFINQAPDIFDIEVNDLNYCYNNDYFLKINDELIKNYVDDICNISINNNINKNNFSLTFSPLHGTGGEIACKILEKLNYKYYKINEQFNNDYSFPTVDYPNPENKEAFKLSVEYAKKYNCDICIATDPDADRIGIAVKDKINSYRLLNGNEIAIIIMDYLCKFKSNINNSYLIDTIVCSKLPRKIALDNNINVLTTYTGFKFIGKQVQYLYNNNKNILFAFEESYGYLLKNIVRDKDAFQPLVILVEAACYYKNYNKNLIDILNEIYEKYGYYKEQLLSFTFDGIEGINIINNIMYNLRHQDLNNYYNNKIIDYIDYNKKDLIINDINLRKADVIQLNFENDNYIIFRPSGTEPKFKVYIGCVGNNKDNADKILENLIKNTIILIDEFKIYNEKAIKI